MDNITISSSFINRWNIFFRRVLAGQFFGVETFSDLTMGEQVLITCVQLVTSFLIAYFIVWAVKKAVSIFIWG